MSFGKFNKAGATNFQNGKVLVVGMYDSNFPVSYACKADGSKRRMYENDTLEADEHLEQFPCKVISFKPIELVDGQEVFGETLQATIEVNGKTIVNAIDTPEIESYNGQCGAVAVATYTECTAEHDAGNLKKGDVYAKLTKLAYTLDNRSVKLMLAAKSGANIQL